MRVQVPTDRSSIDSWIVAVWTTDTADAGPVRGRRPVTTALTSRARPSAAWGIVPTTQALRGRWKSEPVVTVHELTTGANPPDVDPVEIRDRR